MQENLNNDLLINTWHARNNLYMEFFGEHTSVTPKNYSPEENQELAILTYAPDPLRPYWAYVTSGLSSPWLQDDAQEVSGYGVELMIKSPEQADWPAQILRTMAYYVLNHMGTFSPSVRLALNAPIIAKSNSLIRNVLIWYADEAPDAWYQLPSGGFGLFTAIGVTDDEMRLAESLHEEYGTWCMVQVLRQLGIGQVTDPARESVMTYPEVNSIISSVKNFADRFHEAYPDANRTQSNELNEQN